MLQANLCDHCPLPANDLGVVLGVYSDTQLETPQSLQVGKMR